MLALVPTASRTLDGGSVPEPSRTQASPERNLSLVCLQPEALGFMCIRIGLGCRLFVAFHGCSRPVKRFSGVCFRRLHRRLFTASRANHFDFEAYFTASLLTWMTYLATSSKLRHLPGHDRWFTVQSPFRLLRVRSSWFTVSMHGSIRSLIMCSGPLVPGPISTSFSLVCG